MFHFRRCLFILFVFILQTQIFSLALSDKDADFIGKKIWENECGGTFIGLTSWNTGEDFASLGIGHFIWYPKDKKGPFDEKFPALLAYFEKNGVILEPWLKKADGCPWKNKADFDKQMQTVKMVDLRALLLRTFSLQARFIVEQLESGLPKIVTGLSSIEKKHVEQQFEKVLNTPMGAYALIDYTNFKGIGLSPTERYNKEGWGLLQVLLKMSSEAPDPLAEFRSACKEVLARRVANAPKNRNEERWLKGWNRRIDTYQ